ncbi:response regulator transcription factor [Celerinatantimonas yamalensis]|uniref:Response regulator transcription factor n=1 Tax=Celerinatantimonas yamalensis TaxID=559956 RepID=A0ABW9G8S5_9GAMM
MKLLIVEDHQEIAGIIFDYFEASGHVLDYARNGQQGYDLAKNGYYDAIVLDVMLPRMDGCTVCRKLREEGIDTPVLMLTARDTREDTLAGFAGGADDYLVKPFDLEILEARLSALTRRRQGAVQPKQLQFAELTLDLNRHVLIRQSCQFSLNPSQFNLLKLLMLRAPNVVSKAELINVLWGDDEPERNVLRSHIYQLRHQMDKPFAKHYLKTVPKVGYQLVDEV